MKKKIISVAVLALIGAVILGGCGKTPAPAVTPEPTPEQTQTPVSVKTGIVTDSSMSFVDIEAPDGSAYSFALEDDTTFEGDGARPGNTIEVSFEGEYQENVTAKHIYTVKKGEREVGGSTSLSKTAGTKSTPAAAREGEKYVSGVIEDASMHVVQLKRTDGKTYSVKLDDDTRIEGNLANGAKVQVWHLGKFEDGMTATTIKVLGEGKGTKAAAASPAASTSVSR